MMVHFKFKRIVSGLGMAATFGFLSLVEPILIPISLVVFTVFVILLAPMKIGKWLEVEQGNIETVFALALTVMVYLILFEVSYEVKLAILIISIGAFIAYSRRISSQLKKMLRV